MTVLTNTIIYFNPYLEQIYIKLISKSSGLGLGGNEYGRRYSAEVFYKD